MTIVEGLVRDNATSARTTWSAEKLQKLTDSLNEVKITGDADWGEAVAGVVTLESKVYRLVASQFTTLRFFIPNGVSPVITSNRVYNNIVFVYLGAGTLFTATDISILQFSVAFLSAPTPGAKIFDITGTRAATNIVYLKEVIITQAWEVGKIANVNCWWNDALVTQCSFGLELDNCYSISLLLVRFTEGANASGCTWLTLKGESPLSIKGCEFYVNSNETALNIDRDADVAGLFGINIFSKYEASPGGKFFAAGSLDQSYVNLTFNGNTGVQDSTITSKLKIKDVATQTVAPENVPSPINGIWRDGEEEELMVYEDVCTFDNTTNTITTTFNHELGLRTLTDTTISFSGTNSINDSGNRFLTLGFKRGQQIPIVNSTSNDGVYTIESVTAGTITTIAADTVTTESAGANITLSNPSEISFYTIGTLPAEISLDTKYYVIPATSTTYQISGTIDGSALNFTDDGTGTIYCRHVDGASSSGYHIYIGNEVGKISVSGRADLKGVSGVDNDCRTVIMKIAADRTITRFEDGGEGNVASTWGFPSSCATIISLSKNEGVVMYLENTTDSQNIELKSALTLVNKS